MKPLNPQGLVSKFWSEYHSTALGKVTSIFPLNLHEPLLGDGISPYNTPEGTQTYEEAAQRCRSNVKAIARECERTNAKFSDPEFDIESDFSACADNCLFGIVRACDDGDDDDDDDGGRPLKPGSVHRIPWIFERPQFTISDFSSDLIQGASRNCWWLAALATINCRKDLMERICVARDEECGVYGFVFYRDGEWISTVVDDNLYLTQEDFDQEIYDAAGKKAKLYKKQKQSSSDALFFAKCGDANETWLPLLEKAFAKIHGDYGALDGGWAGTAVEDLTGGVTTVLAGDRVLRKERLWREMVGLGEGDFVFNLSMGSQGDKHRNGLILGHDYSVLEATEVEDELGNEVSLVKIRNPWGGRCASGHGEWNGPWSDGSEEWTPFMMEKLWHKFSDNGTFWMSFHDMLDNFRWIYRTRLFDEGWITAQRWMSVNVPWLGGYLDKRFVIEVQKGGMAVIVLSQLDDRYFQGLKGQYEFTLHFTLRSLGDSTVICQVQPAPQWNTRFVNCEITLKPGKYEVIPNIVAERDEQDMSVERMIRLTALTSPSKLRQVGKQYDRAHAKAGITDDKISYDRTEDGPERKSRLLQSRPKPVADTSGSKAEAESQCSSANSDSDCDSSQQQPWNAVCIVGLRVYTQQACIRISLEGGEGQHSHGYRRC
ncbi:Calpain catalytic domain-containing protein [Fusarium sp. Ph1]|nr:Calpain catalytic domain-containing protein [Fusarium sp. Ph1]